MRLIDADALKDRLQALSYDDWNQGASTTWANAYAECADMVEDMPTIEPERKKGKWIPCRECLPEKSEKYLVTVQNGNVYAGTYDKYSGRFQCAATAWMELPAPYQEDD